jgi:hypothetical protein
VAVERFKPPISLWVQQVSEGLTSRVVTLLVLLMPANRRVVEAGVEVAMALLRP